MGIQAHRYFSNPPDPTNQRQTIIQPAKEKPKVLQEFVPLPNMVKVAKPHLPLPSDLVGGTPDLPEFHPAVQAPAAPPASHCQPRLRPHPSVRRRKLQSVPPAKRRSHPEAKTVANAGSPTRRPWCR